MDAGLTHNPKDIGLMLSKAESNHYDLVIGSRRIDNVKIMHWRTFLSKSALILVRLLGIKQTDVTSGFRCWKLSLLKKINFGFIRSKGFSFQWELLYQCLILKSNIGEICIDYKLTNSSLNRKIIIESFMVWLYYFLCVKLNPFRKGS